MGDLIACSFRATRRLPEISFFMKSASNHRARMIFVNTKYCCPATVSMTQAFKPVWPSFISKLAAEGRCHLNGLGTEDGKARYDRPFYDGYR